MKVRLPLQLFRRLIRILSVPCFTLGSVSMGGIMHQDASFQTYTDFGQNMGRYSTGATNALLQHLHADGVIISYTGGQADQKLAHEMISFESQTDKGNAAAVGYNFIATVWHNPTNMLDTVGLNSNVTFSANDIGASYAIRYQTIELDSRTRDKSGKFETGSAATDYKAGRLSKIITDVSPAAIYSGDISGSALVGQQVYRSGSGTMGVYNHSMQQTGLTAGYRYITGGVETLTGETHYNADAFRTSVSDSNFSASGITAAKPLPFVSLGGDSGSPAYIWNEETNQYEFLACLQSGDSFRFSQFNGNCAWTSKIVDNYNVAVDCGSALGGADHTVYVNAVTRDGGEVIQGNTASTRPWHGSVTDAAGNELADFIGLRSGSNTWKSLNNVMNSNNWYAYGDGYLNAGIPDLFVTQDLVFTASGDEVQRVVLNGNVDQGVGYTRFSKAAGGGIATFRLTSAEGESYMLNSAGYVVDAGVDVHVELTNSADYAREWRKTGEGNLFIEGKGNNYIGLNLGGSGATYLQREGGYAAYNVLANNGTRVIINDVGQIGRDFTFGNGGATLDFNGNSMEVWFSAVPEGTDAFTLHCLDEGGVIANLRRGTTSTLTFKEGGTWKGSFRDAGENGGAVLRVVYDGGDQQLVLNSILTSLSGSNGEDRSAFIVQSGTVLLKGTNTVHGMGSADGRSSNRLFNALDWHYADAAMDVEVRDGAIFRLGDHARLQGDVNVLSGGTLLVNEGVQHELEHIEGGQKLESTSAIRDYWGLHGNVSLQSGARMQIAFSEGATVGMELKGGINGDGSLNISLGSNGLRLVLSGDNASLSGEKILESGTVQGTSLASMGDVRTNKWSVGEQGVLASLGFTSDVSSSRILSYIDSSSSGVLALAADRTETLDMSSHTSLFIGALEGTEVHYGSADTALGTNAAGQWLLGGGGGALYVDALLEGENRQLVIGNSYGTGKVVLTNAANTASGTIMFGGGVTLDYTEGALGNLHFDLSYTNASYYTEGGSREFLSSYVNENADGILLLDRTPEAAIDLRNHSLLALGSSDSGAGTVFTGDILLNEGQSYRFSGSGNLIMEHLSAGHDVIVDGQTFSGGSLTLTGDSLVTGAVSIMGHRESSPSSSGSMSLSLQTDNALKDASCVTISEGGILNINGTTQTLNNVVLNAGGSISGEGTLVLAVPDTGMTLAGSLEVATVIKQDAGNLTLGGTGSYNSLQVQAGTVTLGSNTAFSSSGTADFYAGTGLLLNGKTANGRVVLHGEGSEGVSVSGGGTFSGTLAVASGTGYVTGNTTFAGLDVASGAVLSLGGSGNFSVRGQNVNASGGTILVKDGSHAFNLAYNGNGSNQILRGTLSVADGASLTLQSNGANLGYSQTKTLNSVRIEEGGRLDLSCTQYNTVWAVNSLSGGGKLNWDCSKNNYYSSQLLLGGNGRFSGTINYRSTNETSGYKYQNYLIFNSDQAVSDAVVNMYGKSGLAMASMGVNTNRLSLRGLDGNANTYLFAGGAKAGNQLPFLQGFVLDSAQASSRRATLTISAREGESHTFSGTVNGSASAGFSLVMDGAGTQTFNGASVTLHDVSVTGGGALNLTAANLSVLGNLTLSGGASLALNSGYNLSAGKTLALMGSSAAPATLNMTGTGNALTLSGGVLTFTGGVLCSDSATLHIAGGGLAFAESLAEQTINFTETASIKTGVTYWLADGDWSPFRNGSFASGALPYLNADFSIADTGLYVTFSAAEGVSIWDGTETSNNWTADKFGNAAPLPGEATAAIFNESAGSHVVNIATTAEVGSLLIDADNGYTFTAAGDHLVSSGSLTHSGRGTTVIESGVRITGTASIESGELVVKDRETLAGAITGTGTLGIDWGSESGSLSTENLGTLHIISGRYEGGSPAGLVRVDDGGQFFVASGTSSSAVELAGAGWKDAGNEADRAGALRLGNGAAVSGAVTLSADAVLMLSGTSGTISHLNTNGHTLAKEGTGTLVLGSTDIVGNLDLKQGTIQFNAGGHAGISSIRMASGTALKLDYNANITNGCAVSMEDGSSINFWNGTGTSNLKIDLNGNISLNGNCSGNAAVLAGTISGTGRLDLGTTLQNAWTISSAISGDLSLSVNSRVTLSGNNSYTGGTVISGSTLTTRSVSALGTGAVTINGGALALGGNLEISALAGTGGSVSLGGNLLGISGGGASTVYAGSITGAAGSGLNVGAGANLGLTGAVTADSVMVGGALALSGTTTVGSMQVDKGGSVTLGGTLNLDYSGGKQGGIVNKGSVSLQEGLDLHLTVGGTGAGSWSLVSGGGISYSGDSLTDHLFIDGVRANRLRVELTQTADELSVAYAGSKTLLWTPGESSSVWNAVGDANWSFEDGSAKGIVFYENDSVIFNQAGPQAVTVAEDGVAVTGMSVQAAGYAFDGGAVTVKDSLLVDANGGAVFNSAVTVNRDLMVYGREGAVFNAALNVAGDVMMAGNTVFTQNFTLADGGTVSFAEGAQWSSRNIALAGNGQFDVRAGVRNTGSGTVSVATGKTWTVALSNDSLCEMASHYLQLTGVLNLEAGENSGGTLVVDGLCLSSTNPSGGKSQLNIAAGTQLFIKGDSAGRNSGGIVGNTGSMMLSNWPGNGGNNEVNVNGVLTSNAVISGRDGASVINVGNAGVLNMLGGLAANTPGRTKNHVINVAGGGRLNAAGGTENQYLKVNLAAGASFGGVGEAGGSASFSNNLALGTAGQEGVVTFDTNARKLNATTYEVENADGGLDLVFSGTMTDAGNTMAAVTGKGSVAFTNNTTFSAGSTVEAGAALKFGSGTATAEIRTGNENSPAVVAGTVSYAAGAGLSVSEGTLSNTKVNMNEDSRLTASGVAMDASSSITGGALVVDGLSIALEGGVTSTDTLMVNTVLLSSSSQEELTIRLDHEARVLSLECISLNDVTVTGSTLMFDFSAFGEWESILEYEYLCLDFSSAGADLSGVSDISVVNGNQVYEGLRLAPVESRSGVNNTGSSIYFEVGAKNVPEPSVAALGLLALSACVMRRRRA